MFQYKVKIPGLSTCIRTYCNRPLVTYKPFCNYGLQAIEWIKKRVPLIVGNSDFNVFDKTSTHSNEYNTILSAYSYVQYFNQQTHSIKYKAQNTIYHKNFNILMIPVRAIIYPDWHICTINQPDALFIFTLLNYHAPTRFGPICIPSSGGS
jgi:hypothetical protein